MISKVPPWQLIGSSGQETGGGTWHPAVNHQSHHFKRLICKSECDKLDVTSVTCTLTLPWLIAWLDFYVQEPVLIPSILRTSSTPDSMVNSLVVPCNLLGQQEDLLYLTKVMCHRSSLCRTELLKVSISSTWYGSNDFFFLIYSDKHAK